MTQQVTLFPVTIPAFVNPFELKKELAKWKVRHNGVSHSREKGETYVVFHAQPSTQTIFNVHRAVSKLAERMPEAERLKLFDFVGSQAPEKKSLQLSAPSFQPEEKKA
jgi:hypothetical protein